MKFTQIYVHHFYELHITNLTSELCTESCTHAFVIPYPELSETDQNRNSKLKMQLGEVMWGHSPWVSAEQIRKPMLGHKCDVEWVDSLPVLCYITGSHWSHQFWACPGQNKNGEDKWWCDVEGREMVVLCGKEWDLRSQFLLSLCQVIP